LTQQELADQAGISRATVIAIEGGQCQRLRVETLVLLAAALGYSTDYLLGHDKPNSPAPWIDTAIFPIEALPDAGFVQKCFCCDSLLEPGKPHTLAGCIFTNHERGKEPGWLAEFYRMPLENLFHHLIEEQRRLRDESLLA
jgi:DNA-binding XRE family transcriptional regulator